MDTFRNIVDTLLSSFGNVAIPIIFGLAVLTFIWNITHFIANANNEAERTKFRKYSINSILALFIMIAVWGIVGIMTQFVFNTSPFVPQLPVTCEQDPGCVQ